ncbi:hypothetical protein EV421DRAFT_1761696 [Armillaria borealis]|uniref:Uncharacterized protein n=1 Tax=Armillaria borealis TaxID=47425 RepID=A0AA39K298_9AGAR|nr:hypothetical protein EV421DRAFT_1761696 [Armillaria borealis]
MQGMLIVPSEDLISPFVHRTMQVRKSQPTNEDDFDSSSVLLRLIHCADVSSCYDARLTERIFVPDSLTETPKVPETLTWKKILEEEPFEGEHWEGVYGLPPGSVKNWREPDSQSDVSSVLSLDSEDLDLEDSSESLPTPPRSPSPSPPI